MDSIFDLIHLVGCLRRLVLSDDHPRAGDLVSGRKSPKGNGELAVIL